MDLTRKARLVARGSMTEATKEQTFASVVSRDTVRLFFLLAALNDLDLLSCDIQNAYLTADCRERIFFKACAPKAPKITDSIPYAAPKINVIVFIYNVKS